GPRDFFFAIHHVSLPLALREDALVGIAGDVVGLPGGFLLGGPYGLLLLRPALVHRLDAPLGRLLRRPDRLAVDDDEHRVGVRRREDPQRDPARLLDRDVERDALDVAVRGDLGLGDGPAVDDHLDRDLAAVPDPGALEVPVGFLVERSRTDGARLGRRIRVEMRRDLCRHLHRARLGELQLAPRLAGGDVIDPEIDQVALAVGDVGPALLDPLAPSVEIELALVELDVDPAQADPFAVDA